jgi:hypothetical protein
VQGSDIAAPRPSTRVRALVDFLAQEIKQVA